MQCGLRRRMYTWRRVAFAAWRRREGGREGQGVVFPLTKGDFFSYSNERFGALFSST